MAAEKNSINPVKCIKCSKCVSICPIGHLDLIDGKIQESENPMHACIACGHCMSVCPTEAIVIKGYDYSEFERLPDVLPSLADFEMLLKARRSCRNYQPLPVSREHLDKIIETASTAPMAIPPHQVEILVFDTREKIEQFLPDARKILKNWIYAFGSPFIRTMMGMKMPAHQMKSIVNDIIPLTKVIVDEYEKNARDYLTYGATAMLVFHSTKYADSFEENCHIVYTYAMIAAEGLGLGSCIIGMIPPIIDQNKQMKERYGIPKDNKVCGCLILGHPRSTHNRSVPRKFKSVRWL